ncbi:Uncharacterised protein [uncultured archaeon]|nr:Uncharacterised protein [uncultured archaeon]
MMLEAKVGPEHVMFRSLYWSVAPQGSVPLPLWHAPLPLVAPIAQLAQLMPPLPGQFVPYHET